MPRSSASPLSPLNALVDRFKQLWWLKAIGTTLFMWVFFTLYFQLQQRPDATPLVMPLTWLDQAIPMQAWGWVPYLSLWLYTSLPPAFQPTFRSLLYYAGCMIVLCGLGLLCFYWWPTSVPPVYKPLEAQLSWIQGVDTAGNACPSLHVATAIFSCFWLDAQLAQVGAKRQWRILNMAWCALIVYSTLVTKQHAAWDVFAGGLLGMVGGRLSLRGLSLGRQS